MARKNDTTAAIVDILCKKCCRLHVDTSLLLQSNAAGSHQRSPTNRECISCRQHFYFDIFQFPFHEAALTGAICIFTDAIYTFVSMSVS